MKQTKLIDMITNNEQPIDVPLSQGGIVEKSKERVDINTPNDLTGGHSDYYRVNVGQPTRPDNKPYLAECNDCVEALDMRSAEANVFKATWRRAAARQGNGKPDVKSRYDAEKMLFFSFRELVKDCGYIEAKKYLLSIVGED